MPSVKHTLSRRTLRNIARLRNDLYCDLYEWDVKLYYTIPHHIYAILAIPLKQPAY